MDIANLKAIELEILKAFVQVCDKLKLKYYLLEGTLLGAVRHKGFIPWDDDIDVGMPREDYERFMLEGQRYLPEWYFVQNLRSEKDYRANFAKIRDSRTTFIETSVRHCNINHGIYIDIFPLDYCFENEEKQKKIARRQLLMNVRIASGFYSPNKRVSPKLKIMRMLSRLKYPTIRSALLAREKLIQSLPQSGFYANYCSAWHLKEHIPSSWFGKGTLLEFEGLQVRCPLEYDKWLTKVYGDYMQLPPEEKRITHHYADVIDTEKSYTYYNVKKNSKEGMNKNESINT